MRMTIADEVLAKVERLADADPKMSQAAAIRTVAEEMGRSVSATSSAFTRARRARDGSRAARAPVTDRPRTAGHANGPALYAEMLPLVEAGATVEQAARRFGDEDAAAEIAAGFARWADRTAGGDADGRSAAAPALRALGDAEARIASLEAENRTMRRDLTRASQALRRIEAILGPVSDLP